jgi:hypothetical protein
MAQAIKDGLAPIAQSWSQDPVTVMDQNINPYGKSKIARAVGGAKDAVARGLEKFAGSFAGSVVRDPHQALLWRNVLKLQVGIYKNARDSFIKSGLSPEAAGIAAAHVANRYAGALPAEHLHFWANVAANVLLFSRSFTLGNLGVMKDALKGAPPHILAAIETASGQSAQAKVALKKKAQFAVALDVGLHVIGNAMLSMMFATAMHTAAMGLVPAAERAFGEWRDKMTAALADVRNNPLEIAGVWPQHWNEPGKQDRVYVGNDASGRGIYIRPMTGKVGEEMLAWITKPNEVLANKENPMISGLLDLLPNLHDRYGRALTNENPRTVGDYLDNAGKIVEHLFGGLLPLGPLGDAKQAVTGPDRGMAALRLAGQISGAVQFSRGFPGGPQAGVEYAAKKRDLAIETTIMPDVRQKMQAGDDDGARAIIEKSDMSDYGKMQAIRGLRYQMRPARDRRAPAVDWQTVNAGSAQSPSSGPP